MARPVAEQSSPLRRGAPTGRGGLSPEARGGLSPEARGGLSPEARGGLSPEARGGLSPETLAKGETRVTSNYFSVESFP